MVQNRSYATVISIELRRGPRKVAKSSFVLRLNADKPSITGHAAETTFASVDGPARGDDEERAVTREAKLRQWARQCFQLSAGLTTISQGTKCWHVESLGITAAGVMTDDSKDLSN